MGRGGYRKGSGRKPTFPREEKTKAVRLPEGSIEAVKSAILERKLFIDREKLEKISTDINFLLIGWGQATDQGKWERLRKISRKLSEFLEE